MVHDFYLIYGLAMLSSLALVYEDREGHSSPGKKSERISWICGEVSWHDGCGQCWPRDEDQWFESLQPKTFRVLILESSWTDSPNALCIALLLFVGSQFFIAMGRLPSLDGKHTLFGKALP